MDMEMRDMLNMHWICIMMITTILYAYSRDFFVILDNPWRLHLASFFHGARRSLLYRDILHESDICLQGLQAPPTKPILAQWTKRSKINHLICINIINPQEGCMQKCLPKNLNTCNLIGYRARKSRTSMKPWPTNLGTPWRNQKTYCILIVKASNKVFGGINNMKMSSQHSVSTMTILG